MNIDIYGHGQVARALIADLPADIRVRRVYDSKGLVHEDLGADGPTAVVDCTAPAYTGPRRDAWNQTIRSFLDDGVPVVTCNKAPLATDPSLAKHATPLLAAATVGGGTPILPVIDRLAPQVRSLRLVASGTLSSICDSVAVGRSIAEAVHHAQAAGYAEPDPRLDLDGTDTLAKAVIVHNRIWPALSLDAVPDRLHLHPGPIQAIARDGGKPRVVARIGPGSIRLEIADAGWAGAAGDAALRVDAGRAFLVTGPGAGPRETAANIIADLQQLRVSVLA